ncbi:MAG: DNRLRE domain-containing protein, partial [Fibrobacterota bacterium]
GAFKVLGLYPDSSVDTLSETFAWTLLPDTLAGVSPAGQVTTGLYAGIAAVQCSSAAPGWTASANLIVRPFIYLRPIADAFTRDGSYANVNYGTDSILPVKTANSGYTRKAFFKFNLSRLSGLTIESVTFKVRAYLPTPLSGACIAGVYPISTDSWTENTLTWSNQPALGPALDTFSFASGATTVWYETDVTSYVNQELAKDSILSLGLYDPGAADIYLSFLSRESRASSPMLEVLSNDIPTAGTAGLKGKMAPFIRIQPNPFNPSVVITFSIPAGQRVILDVFDVKGGRITRLLDGQKDAGEHKLVWAGTQQASGVYLLRMQAGTKVLERKLVYLK